MAYVDELTLKQCVPVITDHSGEKPEISVNEIEDESDAKVLSNFQIARQLKEKKTKLVEALSHFPVTALWLIYEYEQRHDKKETEQRQEEDDGFISESITALAEVKKYYYRASDSFFHNAASLSDEHQHLTDALKLFPFSFHDLTRLVDILAHAYTYRSAGNPSFTFGSTGGYARILKRLQSLERRSNLVVSNFLDTVKACSGSSYDEQFLFLKISEMHIIFTQLVLAEQQWLNSREQLATANTRLVLFIANQYKGGFLEFDDLVQEGQTGLLKAVDRYDYRLGYKFSTYAGYWIRQAISRALSRCERVVRIPCGQMGVINKVFRAREQLVSQLGKDPTVNELSDFTNLPITEINTILSISQSAVSIEDSSEDEDSVFSPIDFLEQQVFTHPFGDIAQADLEQLITKAIKLLSPREAKVICGHFGIHFYHEMTLKEIGNELNLTRERVRQIQVAALNKIRMCYGHQLATCL